MKKILFLTSFVVISIKLSAQQTINQYLRVNSNGINSTEIVLNKEDNVSYHNLFSNNGGFGIYNSSSDKTNFFINYADNIGIGTTEPQQKLDVRGNAVVNGSLISTLTNLDIGGSLILDNPAKITAGIASRWQIFNMGGGYGNSLQFWAYDGLGCNGGMCANKFTIMDNGNVGIGTTSPSSKLDVTGVFHVVSPAFSQYSGGQGTYIGWNKSGGGGEVNFVNSIGGGTISGFAFDDTSDGVNFNRLMTIHGNGNVGIGTTTPNAKLAVNGTIKAIEIKVDTQGWPDYVFDKGYNVGKLDELESYIKTNKRLPEMPSAKEVEANGLNLGDVLKLQQKKIEELTLHLIEKDKQLTEEKNINAAQQNELETIKKNLSLLMKKNKL